MARYHATVETRRDANDAFTYLADFSSTAEWDPGVVEAERLTEGPITVGATFRVVTSFLGRRIPLDYEITTLEPGRRVVLGLAFDHRVCEPASAAAYLERVGELLAGLDIESER